MGKKARSYESCFWEFSGIRHGLRKNLRADWVQRGKAVLWPRGGKTGQFEAFTTARRRRFRRTLCRAGTLSGTEDIKRRGPPPSLH